MTALAILQLGLEMNEAMERPRVKPEHAPYRISNGRIRLGGVSFGIAAEVVDEAGSVRTLLQSMDGTSSVDEMKEPAGSACVPPRMKITRRSVSIATTPRGAVANAVGEPSAGISGYLMAHAALALITDVPAIAPGLVHGVNLVELAEPFGMDHPRRADCPACADTV